MMKSTYIKFEEKMQNQVITYLRLCKQNNVFPAAMTKVDKPKISIIIPMFNEEKHITLALRTIQNQSLREIEIICVNDCSTDNTSNILKQFQKEDPRIIIINNKKNRGVLYNRIYGALQSTGEYVAFMDADDAYTHMRVLENIYKAATDYKKPEIVHFLNCGGNYDGDNKWEDIYLFNTYNPNTFRQVFEQPEIGDNFMQGKKHITGSGLVYDKIYSRACIKRIADTIGEDLWNQHLVYMDDFIVAFTAMKKTKSIVVIDEIGYWHWFDNNVSMTTSVFETDGPNLKNPQKTNKKLLDYLMVKEKVFELTEDDKDSETFREETLRDLENPDYMKGLVRSIHFQRALNLYEKMINWKHITHDTKMRVIEGMEKLIEAQVPLKDQYDKYIRKLYED